MRAIHVSACCASLVTMGIMPIKLLHNPGVIQVRENWKSQGKSQNVFQSFESQGTHKLSVKVRELKIHG